LSRVFEGMAVLVCVICIWVVKLVTVAEAYKESIRIELSRRSYPAAFTLIGTRYL